MCACLATSATVMDVFEKRNVRKWGLKNYYGDYCWWCVRANSVRYGHLNIKAFNKWMLKSEENLVEARLTAAAYMSLREEGKTQVTTESLFARLELLDRMATFWPSVKDNSHCRIMLLAEYCEKNPGANPIAVCEVVEVELQGSRRLGVRVPRPLPSSPAVRPGVDNVKMSPSVRCDNSGDWELLENFASASDAPRRVVPPSSPSTPALGRRTAMSVCVWVYANPQLPHSKDSGKPRQTMGASSSGCASQFSSTCRSGA